MIITQHIRMLDFIRAIPFLSMGDPRSPKCLTPPHTPYNMFFLHLAYPLQPVFSTFCGFDPPTTLFSTFCDFDPLQYFFRNVTPPPTAFASKHRMANLIGPTGAAGLQGYFSIQRQHNLFPFGKYDFRIITSNFAIINFPSGALQ